jgi:hypothetical protein
MLLNRSRDGNGNPFAAGSDFNSGFSVRQQKIGMDSPAAALNF